MNLNFPAAPLVRQRLLQLLVDISRAINVSLERDSSRAGESPSTLQEKSRFH